MSYCPILESHKGTQPATMESKMTFYEEVLNHIQNGGAVAIKSYTKPVFISQTSRIKPAHNGLMISTDCHGKKWNFVMQMHLAFYSKKGQ